MSIAYPFLTGLLSRRREVKDFERQADADLIKALEVQASANANDLEVQYTKNIGAIQKSLLESYVENHDKNLSFGGSNISTQLLGLVQNGSLDGKDLDANTISSLIEQPVFKFKKPDDKNPTEFLFDLQTQYVENKAKFNEYFSENTDDFASLTSAFITSIANYDKMFRVETDAGRITLNPNLESQFASLLEIPQFANALDVYLGQKKQVEIAKLHGDDNKINDIVSVETKVDDVDLTMNVATEGITPSLIGLNNDEVGNDKLQKVLDFMTINDPDGRSKDTLKNEIQIDGNSVNEYAKALVVALPFATKLNTATNADVANLSNYIAGKEVIIDGNVFQTDFFKGDEARVADLFLFMSTKKNVVNQGNMVQTTYTLDEKELREAQDRNEAADQAIRLVDDYLDILNISEGYGLPDNQVIRNFIASFEGLRAGITSTQNYLAGQTGGAYGTWAQTTLNRLNNLSNGIDGILTGEGINDANKSIVLNAMTEFTQTALAYQVSMAFQGGSGGRTVSNEDFALVLKAIKGGAFDTYESQRARLLSLKKFLEAPLVTSDLLIMHGVQGKNAAMLYDRYYRRKTGINLNSANSINNETNITEFTNAFQAELTLAPQDGGFDDTFIDSRFVPTKDLRSRIFIVNIDPNDASKGQVAIMNVFKGGMAQRNNLSNLTAENTETIILNVNADQAIDNRFKFFFMNNGQASMLPLDDEQRLEDTKGVISGLKKGSELSDAERNSVLGQFNSLKGLMGPANIGKDGQLIGISDVAESEWFTGS